MPVTLTIGSWAFSFACDPIVGSGFGAVAWKNPAFHAMAGGVVGALASAVAGLIDLLSLPTAARRAALVHVGIAHTVVALFVADIRLRRSAPDAVASIPSQSWLSTVGIKRSGVVEGCEYERDRCVVLTDDEFRQANRRASQTICMHAFDGAGEIPVEHVETPRYLAPTKRGGKVYALPRETLRSAQRVAVA